MELNFVIRAISKLSNRKKICQNIEFCWIYDGKQRKCLFENNLILLSLKLLTSSMSVATSPSTSIGALDFECLFSLVGTWGRCVMFLEFNVFGRSLSDVILEPKIKTQKFRYLYILIC